MLNILKPKSTTSQPTSQPASTPEVIPEAAPEAILKATPVTDQDLAEATAAQVGYQPGEEVTGRVTPRKLPNKKFVVITVPDWTEPAMCAVQNADDWSAGERIKCRFVKADAQGRLVFENRDGIRRNRWRR
jgi:hypothetical protein